MKNFTAFYNSNEAVSMAKAFKRMNPEISVKVTEMDFDSRGFPWELDIWNDKLIKEEIL